MDAASNGTMDDEFGTHKEEDVVQQILEKGTIIESEVLAAMISLKRHTANMHSSGGRP